MNQNKIGVKKMNSEALKDTAVKIMAVLIIHGALELAVFIVQAILMGLGIVVHN